MEGEHDTIPSPGPPVVYAVRLRTGQWVASITAVAWTSREDAEAVARACSGEVTEVVLCRSVPDDSPMLIFEDELE